MKFFRRREALINILHYLFIHYYYYNINIYIFFLFKVEHARDVYDSRVFRSTQIVNVKYLLDIKYLLFVYVSVPTRKVVKQGNIFHQIFYLQEDKFILL